MEKLFVTDYMLTRGCLECTSDYTVTGLRSHVPPNSVSFNDLSPAERGKVTYSYRKFMTDWREKQKSHKKRA